jgi:hypothetical protein
MSEDAFKMASVAAHDWSMMQDGDIHLLNLQRAKIRKNKVEGHRLLSQQSLFDKSQNFYTMSGHLSGVTGSEDATASPMKC